MILVGKLWKDGRYWLIECPALDAMTQGLTKKEALEMMVDWLQTALGDSRFKVHIAESGKSGFQMRFDDPKPILGLMIDRARGAAGLTYQEVAQRVGLKSRSGIKTMASGKHDPRFSKIANVLSAIGYDFKIDLVPSKK
jgi:predicted RNase H-like HicB family nuclease